MRTGWRYALAGLFIAGIAAVISYNDGLFVARLAGNHDHQAYLYPLLPDGLIVVCLLALVEAARAQVPRSRWATAGLVLGIALTLAMNAGAGVAHSVLDAVIDGMVPVVFFIAVEVVLWHVRRGRGVRAPGGSPAAPPGTVPSTSYEAAETSMAAVTAAGNPWSQNQLHERFGLPRSEARALRRKYVAPQGEEGRHGEGQVRVRPPHREADQEPAAAAPAEGRQGQVADSPAGVVNSTSTPGPPPAGAYLNGHGGAHG